MHNYILSVDVGQSHCDFTVIKHRAKLSSNSAQEILLMCVKQQKIVCGDSNNNNNNNNDTNNNNNNNDFINVSSKNLSEGIPHRY